MLISLSLARFLTERLDSPLPRNNILTILTNKTGVFTCLQNHKSVVYFMIKQEVKHEVHGWHSLTESQTTTKENAIYFYESVF